MPRLGLDFNAQRRAVLDNHVQQTLRLAADVQAGRAPAPDLVVWPENSSDIDPYRNADAAADIAAAARAVGAPILVGAVVQGPGRFVSNTAIVWDPVDRAGRAPTSSGTRCPSPSTSRPATSSGCSPTRSTSSAPTSRPGSRPGVLSLGGATRR